MVAKTRPIKVVANTIREYYSNSPICGERGLLRRGKTSGQHPKAVFLDGGLKVETFKEYQDVAKQETLCVDSLKLASIKGWRYGAEELALTLGR